MNEKYVEKSLKHFLKCNGGYTIAALVGFLINNQITLGSDNSILTTKYKELEIKKIEVQKALNRIQQEINELEDSKKNSTTHILFSPQLQSNKNNKIFDNHFVINKKPSKPDTLPPVKIKDLVSPITPNIPVDITFPTDESELVAEPKVELVEIGDIVFKNIPTDLKIQKVSLSFSPKVDQINFDLSKINKDGLTKPKISPSLINVNTDININDNVSINVGDPEISDSLDVPLFDIPEFTLNEPQLILPTTFSIVDINLYSEGLDQTDGIGILPENSPRDSVVQNLASYKPKDGTIYVKFTNDNISYGNTGFYSGTSNLGKGVMYLDGQLNGNKAPTAASGSLYNTVFNVKDYALRNHFITKDKPPKISAFITDLRNRDTLIEGNYNFKYESATKSDNSRIFTSINPAGLATTGYGGHEKTVITKITNFTGVLNLTTSNNLTGALVGFEHQIWDKYNVKDRDNTMHLPIEDHFFKSSSVFLNSGEINIGDKNNIGNDTNIIGVAIDIEQSEINSSNVEKKVPHKFVNNGIINMYAKNSVGVSFEPFQNQGILKYEAYLGKINMYGNHSYGLRMRNIFTSSDDYFDNLVINGNTENNTIKIEDTDANGENNSTVDKIDINNYTSNINVQGEENIGIMIGKSLSKAKSSNPISNFKNINLLVDGTKTIGLLRDKNYSSNNDGDIIINDSNFNTINFGSNAKDSVLLRSEMYGITLDKDLNINLGSNQENVETLP